ncbi:T9SS type A sorting domain-containing protein, partial [candidate division KSB1 bacterium]|nr:T9SS type A sorting domain-containing protein [candidate division KSB1 bacterium]
GIPVTFRLKQNYPNPFNPETAIQYHLPKTSEVRLIIYNLAGQLVTHLVDEQQHPGVYSVMWDGKDQFGNDVASGVYCIG